MSYTHLCSKCASIKPAATSGIPMKTGCKVSTELQERKVGFIPVLHWDPLAHIFRITVDLHDCNEIPNKDAPLPKTTAHVPVPWQLFADTCYMYMKHVKPKTAALPDPTQGEFCCCGGREHSQSCTRKAGKETSNEGQVEEKQLQLSWCLSPYTKAALSERSSVLLFFGIKNRACHV